MARRRTLRSVAILVETSRGYGRQVIRGVMRYAHEHGPWSVRLEPRNVGDPPPGWLKHWRGDGILVRVDNRATARAVLATGLPAIDLRGVIPGTAMPLIGVDNLAIARIAAAHLLDSGFRHFGFANRLTAQRFWIDQRRDAFVQAIAEAGFKCHVFDAQRRRRPSLTLHREQRILTQWLRSLPKPAAVFACDDERGHEVINAANAAGIHVPEHLAVLGVDNDELFCLSSDPPLSSIDVHTQLIGYRAAEALDRLMRRRGTVADVRVPPLRIVVRASTDIIAITEPRVARAVRFIRQHVAQGPTVEDVAHAVGVSRSTLERLMRQNLGRSPKAEILGTQLNRVKELLVTTDLPLAPIAARSGFASFHHMAKLFRRRVGCTPGEFRKGGTAS